MTTLSDKLAIALRDAGQNDDVSRTFGPDAVLGSAAYLADIALAAVVAHIEEHMDVAVFNARICRHPSFRPRFTAALASLGLETVDQSKEDE